MWVVSKRVGWAGGQVCVHAHVSVRVRACAGLCACVRACARACMRECVRACRVVKKNTHLVSADVGKAGVSARRAHDALDGTEHFGPGLKPARVFRGLVLCVRVWVRGFMCACALVCVCVCGDGWVRCVCV